MKGLTRVFDAHVHLMPACLLGKKDKRSGALYDCEGRIHPADGEVFDYIPSSMGNATFSADALIAWMDRYGVDQALILQSSFFRISDEIARAVAKYPVRLRGAMVIEPREGWQDEMTALHAKGLIAAKYEMRGFTSPVYYPQLRLDMPEMMEIYSQAGKLNITIVIDPGPVGWKCYQPDALKRAICAHPATRFVICHLGMPSPRIIGDMSLQAQWQEMVALAAFENVWFDTSAIPDLFAQEGYPFETGIRLFASFIKKYGTKKTIWGSDLPGALKNATYEQMAEIFLQSKVLDEAGIERLFYTNAQIAYPNE